MSMKKWISGAVVTAMLGTMMIPAAAKDFPDTNGHWAQAAIGTWSDRGVLNGDDQGNFRPDDSVTRAETATVLDNLISYEKQSVKVFSDVKKEDWFALAVSRLYEAGVITGYEDGTIRPTNGVTRQEAAVMIGRALGLDVSGADQSVLNQFSDQGLIQTWARPTVALMLSRGYIQGSDGAFRPEDPITRAELVTILNNMIAIYATEEGGSVSGSYGNKLAVVKSSTTFNGVTLGGLVIGPQVSGKVNLNSGTRIDGNLYNLSSNVTLNTAGATVDSITSPNGTVNNGRNNYSGGSGSGSGSGFGGGNGGSGQTTTYRVTFMANGGNFGLESSYTISCSRSSTYRVNAPNNPTRTGYTFVGWYFTQTGANELDPDQAVNMSALVSGNTILYAGWDKISGKYGDVLPATGKDVAGTGKSATELMTNVLLDGTNTADHYRATGALKYVNDYEGAPSLSKEGNFLALTYTLPSSLETPANAVVTSTFGGSESEQEYKSFTNSNRSFTRVFYVTAATKKNEIVFSVDLTGEGKRDDLHEIVIDITRLTLDANSVVSETVTNEEEFAAALAKEKVNQVVVDGTVTLKDNTVYAAAGVRKTVVLSTPLQIAAGAAVTLKNLDFKTAKDQTPDSIVVNETAEPAPTEAPPAPSTSPAPTEAPPAPSTSPAPTEAPPAPSTSPAPTESPAVSDAPVTSSAPVTSNAPAASGQKTVLAAENKAAALIVEGCSVRGTYRKGAIASLQVNDLTVKNSMFYGSEGCGIEFADVVNSATVEGNTFDGYNVALSYGLVAVSLKKNAFLDNVTDVSLTDVSNRLPDLSENYYKDGAVVVGGAAIVSPAYTDEKCTKLDSKIAEGAYLFIDDGAPVNAAGIDKLELPTGGTMTVRVIPMDARSTEVIINDEAKAAPATVILDRNMTLKIQIGSFVHNITVMGETPAVPQP